MDTFECPKCKGLDKESAQKLEKLKTFFQRTPYNANPKHWDKHVDELLSMKGVKSEGTFHLHLHSFLYEGKLRIIASGMCDLCNYLFSENETYDL